MRVECFSFLVLENDQALALMDAELTERIFRLFICC